MMKEKELATTIMRSRLDFEGIKARRAGINVASGIFSEVAFSDSCKTFALQSASEAEHAAAERHSGAMSLQKAAAAASAASDLLARLQRADSRAWSWKPVRGNKEVALLRSAIKASKASRARSAHSTQQDSLVAPGVDFSTSVAAAAGDFCSQSLATSEDDDDFAHHFRSRRMLFHGVRDPSNSSSSGRDGSGTRAKAMQNNRGTIAASRTVRLSSDQQQQQQEQQPMDSLGGTSIRRLGFGSKSIVRRGSGFKSILRRQNNGLPADSQLPATSAHVLDSAAEAEDGSASRYYSQRHSQQKPDTHIIMRDMSAGMGNTATAPGTAAAAHHLSSSSKKSASFWEDALAGARGSLQRQLVGGTREGQQGDSRSSALEDGSLSAATTAGHVSLRAGHGSLRHGSLGHGSLRSQTTLSKLGGLATSLLSAAPAGGKLDLSPYQPDGGHVQDGIKLSFQFQQQGSGVGESPARGITAAGGSPTGGIAAGWPLPHLKQPIDRSKLMMLRASDAASEAATGGHDNMSTSRELGGTQSAPPNLMLSLPIIAKSVAGSEACMSAADHRASDPASCMPAADHRALDPATCMSAADHRASCLGETTDASGGGGRVSSLLGDGGGGKVDKGSGRSDEVIRKEPQQGRGWGRGLYSRKDASILRDPPLPAPATRRTGAAAAAGGGGTGSWRDALDRRRIQGSLAGNSLIMATQE